MSTTALVSVEDYLRRTDKPLCEYVNGALHPKPMPTKLHALAQYMLLVLLRRQGVEALAELTVRLSATRYLIPDVVAAPTLESPYPTEPVLLCAEVLSPDDRVGAMLAKCEEYHAWGVPFCWIIDPEKETAWQYDLGGDPQHLDRSATLTAGNLRVPLQDHFSEPPR
jgi:Uma2 family endonuclease